MGNIISRRKKNHPKVSLPLDILYDALLFADRFTIHKCQLVCHQWNTSIHSHSSSFKQCYYRFESLHIGNPLTLFGRSAKNWLSLPAFQHCCNSCNYLNDYSESMVDTLLKPNNASDDAIFQVELDSKETGIIYLKLANQFTATTAFNLIHLLNHLNDGCIFERIVIRFGINVSFLADMPFTSIHCHYLHIEGLSYLQETLAISAFKPREIWCRVYADRIEDDLERINSQGPLPSPISLIVFCGERDKFIGALEYLHLHDVSLLNISKVELLIRPYKSCGDQWGNWPMPLLNFNSMTAMNSRDEQWRERRFVFSRVNLQSGREYKVVVKLTEKRITRPYYEKIDKLIVEMR